VAAGGSWGGLIVDGEEDRHAGNEPGFFFEGRRGGEELGGAWMGGTEGKVSVGPANRFQPGRVHGSSMQSFRIAGKAEAVGVGNKGGAWEFFDLRYGSLFN